ncbi:MAG: aldehyde-activating protein [Gammaproteobacteria bacterium]|nr:aldehyde-activating protein [Gammaproteobacteria bacterium]HJN97106.1 GFA family protein [Gammaproteobacteria bacterium]
MTILIGSCHCGAVEFEVDAPEGLHGLRRCNCSLCRKKAATMATARLTELTITRGEDQLSLYQWNTKIAKHYFCSACGIYTHHQRRKASDEYGFNVACIEDIDLTTLGDIPMTDGLDLSVVGED